MNSKLKKSNFIYRKLEISDYHEFKKLFYFCFNKKINFDFFKWRYFSNKYSFCYGAFENTRLIANVGMISIQMNNSTQERIFSDLLKRVKKKISKKVRIIVMWPNKNNHSNFGIETKKIIKKNYYLYKASSNSTSLKKTKNHHIDELLRLKGHIENENNFFLKNFLNFKQRYLLYQKNDYFINSFKFKKLSSFFIMKLNKDNLGSNYVILDHFGSKKIKSKHLSSLICDQNKLIFLSNKKINKPKIKLLNNLCFKVGFIKRFTLKQKKKFLLNKEIFLGDTDIFLTLEKT